MKKKTIIVSILVIIALCVAAWSYGYYNHKSNDNLPPLKSIVTMDEGDANALLTGYHTEQLMEVWGEPNKATTNELVWQVGDSVLVVSANNKGKVVVDDVVKETKKIEKEDVVIEAGMQIKDWYDTHKSFN